MDIIRHVANVCLVNFRARYRDLLGTAETIVEMNMEIQDVEGKLTDIGRRCNKNLIDKKSIHLNRLKHDAAGSGMVLFRQDNPD